MAYSKQNFQDGQILTAANLEKMENGIIAGQGAENLLDNSDFSNYINSRGGISTAGVWDYCIDRWRAFGTAGQLVWHNSDHVALGALRGINQEIKNKSRFVGKTYTLAAKDADGTLYITSGTYGGDSNHIWKETNGMELRLYSVSDDDNIYFSLKNLSSDTSKFIYLKWAALYEGAYDESTLPPYVPKGKHVEMLNCNVPIAPHNLLDNSDFRNPVNQRGKTSYGGGEYTIDRWKNQSDTNMALMDGFIRITGSWDAQQILGNKLIGTYTYAIYAKVNVAGEYTQTIEIYENGSTIATSFCTTVGEWKIFTCTATFTGGTNPVVTINNRAGSVSDASIDVKWAALYEGSYDASTLPAYQPKGYAAELVECQRYYIHDMGRFTQGIIMPSGTLRVSYPVPTTMRTNPTVIVNSLDNAVIFSNEYSTIIGLTACSFYNKKDNAILVDFSTTLNEGDYKYCVATTYATSISLSADL